MFKPILILLLTFSVVSSKLRVQGVYTEAKGNVIQTHNTLAANANPQFKAQLTTVYKASQTLKEALVSSDTKKAKQAATETKKALSQVDGNLLKDKAHTDWMGYQTIISSSLDKIESEDKLKAQRNYFASFSEAIYKSVKTFGIEGGEAFYQYCPMALEGEGAYWLSDSKQIRNPYLGDKMLTCGSIKEAIK